MSKNYIEEVANILGVEFGMAEIASILGVELEEEFKIQDKSGNFIEGSPFKITSAGLLDIRDQSYTLDMLERVFTGEHKIIKKPWIPKEGEDIFYIDVEDDGEVLDDKFNSDDLYSIWNLALGWVFKTREEAEAHKEEIMQQKERILKGELRAELVEVQK